MSEPLTSDHNAAFVVVCSSHVLSKIAINISIFHLHVAFEALNLKLPSTSPSRASLCDLDYVI